MRIITVFCALLGRIPLWIPFVAFIFTDKLPLGAFFSFTVAILLARTQLPRTGKLLRLASLLAWIYIAVAPDGVLPMLITLIAIYALELIAIWQPEAKERRDDMRKIAMQLR
jgi:hypothetical protein